jgi:uncharacterized protein YdiU (UPF0061 family)
MSGARSKLGLFTIEPDDKMLVEDLLAWMQLRSADFTTTFRALSSAAAAETLAAADPDFEQWRGHWLARRARQPQSQAEAEDLMRRHNPAFIPRNHKVEEALDAATTALDFSVFERLLDVVRAPYDHAVDRPEFSTPQPSGLPYRTFCGT